MTADQLYSISFIDKEVHLIGPPDYDEARFRELVTSLLEQCGLSAYEEEIRLAQDRGVAHLITWRDVEKFVIPLLTNYGFEVIEKKWASIPLYPYFHEQTEGTPKILGRAKELIDNYNKAAKESYKGNPT